MVVALVERTGGWARSLPHRLDMEGVSRPMLRRMKKVIVIVVLLALVAFAVKKLQDA